MGKTDANNPQDLYTLHGLIGNQAVQRLIESSAIQRKLTIGKPNDKYEQQADRTADRVMKMSETKTVRRQPEEDKEESVQAKELRRQPEEDKEESVQVKELRRQPEEEKEESVQAKELRRQPEEEKEETVSPKSLSGGTPQVTPDVQSNINSMRGGGKPLPPSTRAFFEPRFNRDFSRVRLHTDSRAAVTAKSINARAFTVGRNIAFGAGQYSPETVRGKRLLAHELVHVVQQRVLIGKNGFQIRKKNSSSPRRRRIGRVSPFRTINTIVRINQKLAGRRGSKQINRAIRKANKKSESNQIKSIYADLLILERSFRPKKTTSDILSEATLPHEGVGVFNLINDLFNIARAMANHINLDKWDYIIKVQYLIYSQFKDKKNVTMEELFRAISMYDIPGMFPRPSTEKQRRKARETVLLEVDQNYIFSNVSRMLINNRSYKLLLKINKKYVEKIEKEKQKIISNPIFLDELKLRKLEWTNVLNSLKNKK